MTHFLLLNVSIELTKNYGGVAKEDGFFILEKILMLLSFCFFAPAKVYTRKKSDKIFQVQFKVSQSKG